MASTNSCSECGAESHPDAKQRLGEHGRVLYSSVDQIDRKGLAARFRPIEWAFNVAVVYGKRTYNPSGEGRTGEAEVLLIDCFRVNPDRLNIFKLRLWETFGLDSSKYEKSWDFEEYARLVLMLVEHDYINGEVIRLDGALRMAPR